MTKIKNSGVSYLRKVYISIYGEEVAITGHHGGQWEITVKGKNTNFMMVSRYPNRIACEKAAKIRHPKRNEL